MTRSELKAAFDYGILTIECEKRENDDFGLPSIASLVVYIADGTRSNAMHLYPMGIEADNLVEAVRAVGGMEAVVDELYNAAGRSFLAQAEHELNKFYDSHIKVMANCTLTNDFNGIEESVVVRYWQDISKHVEGAELESNLIHEALHSEEAESMLFDENVFEVYAKVDFADVSVGSKSLTIEGEDIWKFNNLKEWTDKMMENNFPKMPPAPNGGEYVHTSESSYAKTRIKELGVFYEDGGLCEKGKFSFLIQKHPSDDIKFRYRGEIFLKGKRMSAIEPVYGRTFEETAEKLSATVEAVRIKLGFSMRNSEPER